MKYGPITISLANSKLGATIPSINLPAIITCRENTPCASLCYARRGNYRFLNVQKSLQNNLEIFLREPKKYFEYIADFLNQPTIVYKYFRFHASGDFVNTQYLEGMLWVARQCPQVKFLCFTKKFELVNELIAKEGTWYIPANFKIVFSAWGKDFKIDNPHDLPITYVDFCNKEQNPDIPETAINCTGQCAKCVACWSLHNGQSVVFKQH